MVYLQCMKSTDPDVLVAIEARHRNFAKGLSRAQRWAKSKGGDGGVFGNVAFGTYRVAGIVATEAPSSQWKRYRSVRDVHGGKGFVPTHGSDEENEMLSLSIPLNPIPGLPPWFVGQRPDGREVAGSPSVFVYDGVGYYRLGFEPHKGQSEPRVSAVWEHCPLSDFKAAQAALHDDGMNDGAAAA
jgi:hypothetical protein